MAYRAEGGRIAAVGFAMLSIATGWSVVLGIRFAIRKEIAKHRLWMGRCYMMLCSAVVLRVFGGLTIVMNLEGSWPYQFAAWASWLGPLAIYECWQRQRCELQTEGRFDHLRQVGRVDRFME